MITEGSFVKVVKSWPGVFDAGDIFHVSFIDDNAIMYLNGGSGHTAKVFVTPKEFVKCFEVCDNPYKVKAKRIWTDWKYSTLHYYGTNGEEHNTHTYYRYNGKVVEVKKYNEKLKARSCCCKSDRFDLEKGLNLANKRLIVKILDTEVNDLARNM